MSAPDPRPYAAPTDLVTAADVARWLREWRSAATDRELIAVVDWFHAYDVQDLRNAHDLAQELACQALDARLDRERRQACRRGALAEWRLLRGQLDIAREWEHADDMWTEEERVVTESYGVLYDTLTRALAFRAAARAR